MYHYEDAHGSIDVYWEEGQIRSLCRHGIEIAAQTACPMFSFRLRMASGEVIERNACQGRMVSLQRDAFTAEAAYQFDDLNGTVVRINTRFGGESWMVWRIAIQNQTEAAVEWTDFPQIALRRELCGRKASFYWPFNEGAQIDDIDLREKSILPSRETEYPGLACYALFPGMLESQFVAYELEAGFCLAAHDEKRGLKNIDFLPMDNGVRLKMRIYSGGEFGGDYAIDYDVAGDFFEGGWEYATELYRRWNDQHLPEGLQRITANDKLPEWYNDSPVVIIYPVRGRHDMDKMDPNRLFPYENALPILDSLAEKMQCRIMVLLMHWEGTAPWAPPFVWPPFGGEAMLRGFVNKLHERGHLLGVYLSGLGWTEQSRILPEYNREEMFKRSGYARSMCMSPENKLEYSQVIPSIRSGYDFCAMGKDTAPIITGEVRSIAAAGVDYAQILDQNHGGNPYMCYGRDHGHAPVPGAWSTEATVKLLSQIHDAAPQMLLGCESAASEPYLPYLAFSDNRFHVDWYIGKPVPMFAYLYHEFLNNFMGNQVCILDIFEDGIGCTESLLYRVAYAYAAGDFAALVITDDGRITQGWCDRKLEFFPDQEQVTTLVRHLNRLRRGAGRKYLHEGRMVPSYPVEGVNTFTLKRKTLSDGVEIPCVLTSRWQAQDGTLTQLLLNWTNTRVSVRIRGVEAVVPALDAVLFDC